MPQPPELGTPLWASASQSEVSASEGEKPTSSFAKRASIAPTAINSELELPTNLAPRADSVADLSSLSWVNVLLGWIWPKANTALTQFVHDDLTQRLQEALPAPFKSAHFSRFTLGNNTPEFGPIEVIRHSDTYVEVDLDMRYLSDVDILLDAGTGGITLGIKQLTFAGRLCIVIRPVMERVPIIGAVKVFFPATPTVTLEFTGLAAVAHYPGIEHKIHNTVNDFMRSRLVLPNRKVFCNAGDEEDVDMLEIFSHQPLGVLRVRVLRGLNLAGVNWRAMEVERFTSDPYCNLQLGTLSARSSTVADSADPEWPATEPSAWFVVYHRDQKLEVEVMGEDRGGIFGPRNFTGFLGNFSMPVAHMMKRWPLQVGQDSSGRRQARVDLDTKEVSRDMLHVNDPVNTGVPSQLDIEVEWFDVDSFMPDPAVQQALAARTAGGPVALLSVGIHHGEGFPLEACQARGGLRWRTKVEESEMVSRPGDRCVVDEPEFPVDELGLHPRLYSVIDKLEEKGYDEENMAQIIGAESREVIRRYLECRTRYNHEEQEILKTQQQEDYRESLQWHEVLSHFVRRPESASLSLDLLDGENREIGRVGPLPLGPLLEDPDAFGRQKRSLSLRTDNLGGIASWFLSTSAAHPDTSRFSTVELEVSASLQFLKEGRGLPHRGRG